MKKNTPIVFADGEKVYRQFAEKYITHEKGLFILAPSGVGKTYFINRQNENHWIDGDMLWEATGAHPSCEWWTMGLDVIHEVDHRSDVITFQAKKMGFWILGASNFWLEPDAIVIPPQNIHMKYIKSREENNYDGGATVDKFEQVLSHIEEITTKYEKKGIPIFTSVEGAVMKLSKDI